MAGYFVMLYYDICLRLEDTWVSLHMMLADVVGTFEESIIIFIMPGFKINMKLNLSSQIY